MISIIIPVLNEEKTIKKCLLQFIDQPPPFEIIVVDGGSTDQTKQIVISSNIARLIESDKGRGRQLNAGAKFAKGKVLLFLHADTLLPSNGLGLIREAMKSSKIVGGYFRLEHDSTNFFYNYLSLLINWRSRLPNITPYGDQAIFCSKETFEEINGYKDYPIMEDYDFAKRLKKSGKLVRIDKKVTSSFRRYKRGVIRYMLQCNLIWLLFHLGISPNRLAKLYKDIR
jgi:rSAM/selenodomain-associated transferase 2